MSYMDFLTQPNPHIHKRQKLQHDIETMNTTQTETWKQLSDVNNKLSELKQSQQLFMSIIENTTKTIEMIKNDIFTMENARYTEYLKQIKNDPVKWKVFYDDYVNTSLCDYIKFEHPITDEDKKIFDAYLHFDAMELAVIIDFVVAFNMYVEKSTEKTKYGVFVLQTNLDFAKNNKQFIELSNLMVAQLKGMSFRTEFVGKFPQTEQKWTISIHRNYMNPMAIVTLMKRKLWQLYVSEPQWINYIYPLIKDLKEDS